MIVFFSFVKINTIIVYNYNGLLSHFPLARNIEIHDIMGRTVKTLVNSVQTTGYKSIKWDATDNRNDLVSTGLYFYTIQAEALPYHKKSLEDLDHV